ncbi:MAG: hypothetical protein EBR79_01335 [Proteobacteria bacterium]|nr:hypothetical protein [Pseudomonadota bacterium]NBX86059.1 hypothetical protein [Pseudomonadota bacterium]
MKWGSRYGAEYVNRLYRGIVRHTKGPVQLVCFTDDKVGIVPEVDCRPLPDFSGVPEHLAVKPWRKLTLWRADLGKDLVGRDALVLDVDLVITGPLDGFFGFEPGKFAVWRNPTKPQSGVGNTSVFRFRVGSHPEICARFMAAPEQVWNEEFRIEQELISARLGDGRAAKVALREAARNDPFYAGLGEQVFWPTGWVVSFKEDLLPVWPLRFFYPPRLPQAVRIVVFHGKPDPDEARDGRWPVRGWKRIYKYVRPTKWVGENWG